MSDLHYKVDVNTDPAVRALAKFDDSVNALEGSLNALGSGGALGKLGGTLMGLGGAAGLGALIARGMAFNQTLNDSEIAIANVLAQFQGLNDEAAKAMAAKAMRQLVELEPKTAGTLSDLTDGLMSTIASAQTAKISLEDNIALVGMFANALANANIPANQLGQEFRSILTASIGPDSGLAKILQITNEDVKGALAAGNLVEFLTQKIGKLGQAGDTAAVAYSSLSSAVDKVAGLMTHGLFEDAVQGAKDLAVTLEQNRDLFASMGSAMGAASKGALWLAGSTRKVGEGLGALAGAGILIAQGEDAMTAFDISTTAAAERMRELSGDADDAGNAVADGMNKGTAAADKLRAALDALAEAEKKAKDEAAKRQQQPATGPEGDRDGDGIISRREQRRLDLARRRAERRANSVGRNRGVVHDEMLGLNEWYALNAMDMTGSREGERSFRSRDRVRTAAGFLRAGEFGAQNFSGDAEMPIRQQMERALERINEALLPPERESRRSGSQDGQGASAAEITSRLDAVVNELRKLNEGAG